MLGLKSTLLGAGVNCVPVNVGAVMVPAGVICEICPAGSDVATVEAATAVTTEVVVSVTVAVVVAPPYLERRDPES